MKRRFFFVLLVSPAFLTAPLFAVPDPTPAELKANQGSLDEYRKHPAQLARLRRDATAFMRLPPEQREQLLKLDHDLHDESAASQARLKNILERYARWLESLSETDRRAVKNAPDTAARLVVIRTLRDRDWMLAQPRVVREQWQGLKGVEQTELLAKLRMEERQRQREWRLAVRFWKDLIDGKSLPTRLADLRERDQEGVGEYLMPLLSKQDRLRLIRAEGTWPAYPTTLVELAEAHPFALPTLDGPRSFTELPRALQEQFNKPIQDVSALGKTHAVLLNPFERQWPKFATGVASINRRYMHKRLPRELWAYDFQSLEKPMQQYVEKLKKSLTDLERLSLQNAEGSWPEYTRTIQELARAHQFPPPPWETALSGSPERWDEYRAAKLGERAGVSR